MKTKRLIALLLAALLLAAFSAPAAGADSPEPVRVRDAQGLLAAIEPGAVIELEPGVYHLSEAVASLPEDFLSTRSFLSFQDCWDGLEVVVSGLDGLTIRGLGSVELLVEPRMADVLRFENCTNLTLADLTLGHTPESGICTGDVLAFTGCSGVSLSGLDLFGCGAYGISASNSSALLMENSTIRECSYGLMDVSGCRGFRFLNCSMRDCGGNSLLNPVMSELSFENCSFEGNSALWGFVNETPGNSLRFYGCRFGAWESSKVAPLRDGAEGVSFDSFCVFTEEEKNGVVSVSNPEEFFEAIAPGAVIGLQPGRYDLGAWIAETWESGSGWNVHHPYVRLQECYDGVEAVICGVDGLTILGLGRDRSETELVVEARYADVLGFESCTELALANLTLGHTEGGFCSGSVVSLANSGDAVLTNLDLYGCGTFGVDSFESGALVMRGCTVHDCSEGPIYRYGGWGENRFGDGVFVDSAGGFQFWEHPDAFFERCVFGPTEYASIAFLRGVTLTNCCW